LNDLEKRGLTHGKSGIYSCLDGTTGMKLLGAVSQAAPVGKERMSMKKAIWLLIV